MYFNLTLVTAVVRSDGTPKHNGPLYSKRKLDDRTEP